jgi:predicted phage terminase large subunit-like protein
MKVESGAIRRLIVEMPPRHSKSETCTIKFPAWYLGRHPDRRIILAAHTANLALRFSMRGRNDFAQYGPEVWGLSVDPAASAMYRWDVLDAQAPSGRPPGGVIAAGIGGPLTGQGAHLAIIDDPVKGPEDANSALQRDNIWDWYRFVLRTRLQPDGAVVLVLTRWHEDDPAGRLIKAAKDDLSGDQWVVLRLPALAEVDDPLGRAPGEPLWPDQFSLAALEATRASVGSYVWSALYQQRPQPAGGAVFKRSWFRYFEEDGEYYILRLTGREKRFKQAQCWIFQVCDPAATESERSDYFVLSTWAVTPDRDLLLLDVLRERAETTKHKAIMRSQFERWRPRCQFVENATFGLNIIQECKLDGLPVRPVRADRDTVSRAWPVAARYEVETVFHRSRAPWLTDWEDELVAFPTGTHDDQAVTAAYAGIVVGEAAQPLDEKTKQLLQGARFYG